MGIEKAGIGLAGILSLPLDPQESEFLPTRWIRHFHGATVDQHDGTLFPAGMPWAWVGSFYGS
jgi:hypothetical protein